MLAIDLEFVEFSDTLDFSRRRELLHLYHHAWWAADRTIEEVARAIDNSIPFALIDSRTDTLLAFARVVSDFLSCALILDVMVHPDCRAQGLGTHLMDAVMSYPDFRDVSYFQLHCTSEMTAYYRRFGFEEGFGTLSVMTKQKPLDQVFQVLGSDQARLGKS